jgi:hypothetical protein
MLKCDDYSAVIVKWFACNGLRANDYSAVMLKSKQHNDMRKIGRILGGGNVCALRVRCQRVWRFRIIASFGSLSSASTDDVWCQRSQERLNSQSLVGQEFEEALR